MNSRRHFPGPLLSEFSRGKGVKTLGPWHAWGDGDLVRRVYAHSSEGLTRSQSRRFFDAENVLPVPCEKLAAADRRARLIKYLLHVDVQIREFRTKFLNGCSSPPFLPSITGVIATSTLVTGSPALRLTA